MELTKVPLLLSTKLHLDPKSPVHSILIFIFPYGEDMTGSEISDTYMCMHIYVCIRMYVHVHKHRHKAGLVSTR